MHKDSDIEEELVKDLFLFEAIGFSMWPFLKGGERLVIKKVPIEDLRIGDVILYRSDSQLVCHRLIKKVKNREAYLLYARGDNSVFLPESLTEQAYLGKAIAIIWNRQPISLITKRQQFINRLIVIIAPLIAGWLRVGKVWLRRKR